MLPKLLIIADRFTRPEVKASVLELASAGVLPWVQLRDHEATIHDVSAAARHLVEELRLVSPQTMISINGHVDVAENLGVNLHIGFRGATVRECRRRLGGSAVIGYSHHLDTPIRLTEGADYLTYSPVFEVSKPWAGRPLGLDLLAKMCRDSDRPIVALGGIQPESVEHCFNAGASGVAVLSGIMMADDVAAAARVYLGSLPKPETVLQVTKNTGRSE